MEKLDINACFAFAWDTFKKRPWFFIGVTAFIFLVSFAISFTNTFITKTAGPGAAEITTIVGWIISLYLGFWQIKVFLKAHDSVQTVQFGDSWGIKGFGKYFLLEIYLGIILIVSFILFIIPGIILSIVLMFATFILVDTGIKPVEALKESARLTKGHRWTLLLLTLELLGINIIGAILLILGLLVTVPLSLLVAIHAYRTLQKASISLVSE